MNDRSLGRTITIRLRRKIDRLINVISINTDNQGYVWETSKQQKHEL